MILETPKSEDLHEDVENLKMLRGLIGKSSRANLRQDFEAVAVPRANHVEVAAIDRKHAPDLQALGHRDE